jgi:putative transposase
MNPGRIAQAGSSCLQTHDSEISATGQHTSTTWAELEGLLTYSCRAGLGLRRASLSPISSSTRWQAFFIVELHSRSVIHVGVTRCPTDAWTAQQLREATAYGKGPKYLIRDRDNKFGPSFARVAATSGIKILKTPYQAPRVNAICERFVGSVRRERLDHLFILHEKQLDRVLHAYVEYFNQARPHQGIRQQIPEHCGEPVPLDHERGKILSLPVLGGLHHDYRRSA